MTVESHSCITGENSLNVFGCVMQSANGPSATTKLVWAKRSNVGDQALVGHAQVGNEILTQTWRSAQAISKHVNYSFEISAKRA